MYSYVVKVPQGGAYLWGGSRVNVAFDKPGVLVCHVDLTGDPITLKRYKAPLSSTPTAEDLGGLDEQQVLCISIEGACAIEAKPDGGATDSLVRCTLILPMA